MPSYPIEPEKLLKTADRLAPRAAPRGRPSYTAHRRAVSTAYYAVFHAIGARVATQAFPSADAVFLQRVQRWIGHGDIKTVAGWVSQLQGTIGGNPPPDIVVLLSGHIDAATATIADGFRELNERREDADYDHEAVFPRADTRRLMALARRLVALIETVQSDETERFFGLIAMRARRGH